ncbi:MAG: hypothetical protein ABI690_17315 [Chloroflexota bacterium]
MFFNLRILHLDNVDLRPFGDSAIREHAIRHLGGKLPYIRRAMTNFAHIRAAADRSPIPAAQLPAL